MRYIVRLCLLILAILQFNAAIVSAQFARTYGEASYDAFYSVERTGDGGFIVVGDTTAFGAGGGDGWVLKIDPFGNVQWQRTYGGIDSDTLRHIQLTDDGGYVLTGATQSYGAGGNDVWIVKIDASGSVQWQKAYGGGSMDDISIYSTRQTIDGGYIVAANTDSYGAGSNDLWILKLDSGGNVQWQKTYGGSASDLVRSIQETSDGGYIVAGSSQSFGIASSDLWILKLDDSGNSQWQQTYGSTGSDFAEDIQQTMEGGFVVAGGTSSFGQGMSDAWVLKLSALGGVEWQKTYGGGGFDRVFSVQQTTDGGYVITGQTDSFGAGNSDVWVLRLDSSGNAQWQKAYGGATSDFGYSVQQTIDGGYVIVGYTGSFGVGGEAWLLRLNQDGEIDSSCPLSIDTPAVAAGSVAQIESTAALASETMATATDTNAITTNSNALIFEQCAVLCLFCDDFEDGVLATDWTYLKPAWSESNGDLVATPARKAIAIASPAFGGCSSCSFEASMKTAGGPLNKVWMLAWYIDKQNTVEVLMKEENDKFVLKHRVNGSIAAKTKGLAAIVPNVFYNVKVSFDGNDFTLFVDGNMIATLQASTVPNGTVGFQAKNTTASFGHVNVE